MDFGSPLPASIIQFFVSYLVREKRTEVHNEFSKLNLSETWEITAVYYDIWKMKFDGFGV